MCSFTSFVLVVEMSLLGEEDGTRGSIEKIMELYAPIDPKVLEESQGGDLWPLKKKHPAAFMMIGECAGDRFKNLRQRCSRDDMWAGKSKIIKEIERFMKVYNSLSAFEKSVWRDILTCSTAKLLARYAKPDFKEEEEEECD